MGVLKAAGIVTDRRDAQWVRYRAGSGKLNIGRRWIFGLNAA
jgi:DNA-binding transcriptional ArsR family regulator